MTGKSTKGKKKMDTASGLRASVTFPPELYRTLEKMARQKKVSLAWIVRDAAEKYVGEEYPLFGRVERGERQ